jgi:hypothetical protein
LLRFGPFGRLVDDRRRESYESNATLPENAFLSHLMSADAPAQTSGCLAWPGGRLRISLAHPRCPSTSNGALTVKWPENARIVAGRLVVSTTKGMAALVIMQLVEQRLIDLDAPVVRYEPQFVMADDETREITMRQLLSMSAACLRRTHSTAIRTQRLRVRRGRGQPRRGHRGAITWRVSRAPMMMPRSTGPDDAVRHEVPPGGAGTRDTSMFRYDARAGAAEVCLPAIRAG